MQRRPGPDRRRPNDYITRREFREFYERIKIPLEFFERMEDLGLMDLLPQLLKDERTRQVLAAMTQKGWARWVRAGVIMGLLVGAATVVSLGLNVYFLFKGVKP